MPGNKVQTAQFIRKKVREGREALGLKERPDRMPSSKEVSSVQEQDAAFKEGNIELKRRSGEMAGNSKVKAKNNEEALINSVLKIFNDFFSHPDFVIKQISHEELSKIISEIMAEIGNRIRTNDSNQLIIEIAGKLAEKVEIHKFKNNQEMHEAFVECLKKRKQRILEIDPNANLSTKVEYFTSNWTAKDGRQITDLIVGTIEGDRLVILAFVEVKKITQVDGAPSQHALTLERLFHGKKQLKINKDMVFENKDIMLERPDYFTLAEMEDPELRVLGIKVIKDIDSKLEKLKKKEKTGTLTLEEQTHKELLLKKRDARKAMFDKDIVGVKEIPYNAGGYDNAAALIFNYSFKIARNKK